MGNISKEHIHIVKYILIGMLFCACLFCAGCGSAGDWEYDPITDVNNLEGRRVGVNLAWESDYYLDGRDDMELVRYDTTADMIMALRYDKIDAIALDADSVKLLMSLSEGIEQVEGDGAVGVVIPHLHQVDPVAVVEKRIVGIEALLFPLDLLPVA